MSKRNRKRNKARADEKRSERQQLRADIRSDFAKPPDVAWGTSSQKLGEVKMQSEEARHVTCFECGYGAGRHSGMCSQA